MDAKTCRGIEADLSSPPGHSVRGLATAPHAPFSAFYVGHGGPTLPCYVGLGGPTLPCYVGHGGATLPCYVGHGGPTLPCYVGHGGATLTCYVGHGGATLPCYVGLGGPTLRMRRIVMQRMRTVMLLLVGICLATAERTALAGETVDGLAIIDDVQNRVMLFDRQTGDFLRNLVAPDQERMQAPFDCEVGPVITAGATRHEKTVLVSDIRAKQVLAYDYGAGGKFIAVLIDNITARGIAYDRDGNLLIAAGESGVRKYDANGRFIETLARDLVDGPSNAWDVLARPVGREWWRGREWELLVSDVNLDAILRFDMDGTPRGVFAKRKGFRHVEQLAWRRNSNVLAADPFSNKVYEFTSDGTLLRKIQVRRPRGVIELGNGNILISSQRGVQEFDGSDGSLVATKMRGHPETAPRYIRDLSKKLPTIR